MNPVPKITKNDPLKFEETKEEYQEAKTEKKGKLLFFGGVLFSILILASVWVVFFAWLQNR